MLAQEITYLFEDKNQSIVVEAKGSKEQVEANVYLLSRMLCTVQNLSGDNIKITVKDNDFEGIKRHLGL